ncbi:SlyX family protein [Parahaliea maris]|uniref:SlyX family protein n=1 Tax=Parahaliea maris TaxID=2716870 RepID=A0A5C9A078_9GAMM|nr:SlyX family protein [Parahaliea maris]TXS92821.1 SlyX family protein [Parahaliea maris]
MSDDAILAQLHDLQSQLAFQDDTLSALNSALSAQQQEILLLRRQVELLKQRQDEHASVIDDLPGPGAEQERPPHY